jgi:hypothetical protein
MFKKVFIYGLEDPYTRQIKYIGQTKNVVERVAKHIREARKLVPLWKMGKKLLVKSGRTMKSIWLSELLSLGVNPTVKILEVCDAKDAAAKERKWIQFYMKNYNSLTNYQLVKAN